MELAITLFGYLILTFLAIVVPFFMILLSIFQEGVSKLKTQYENEKSKSEANLRDQVAKQAEAKEADVEAIEQNINKIKKIIKEIKATKKIAETKLSYLNPKKQILRLFILHLISFLGVILAILSVDNIYLVAIFIVVSLVFFALALFILWRLLDILIEVKKIIDKDKKEGETRTQEILLTLADKSEGIQYFLKSVYMTIKGVEIKDDRSEFTFDVNTKEYLKIGVVNKENRMAKKTEIGLMFPRDFIIEKDIAYSIYTQENGIQIVRYETEFIQGNTNYIYKPLSFTPLKKGVFPLRAFIKAENIEATNRDMTFKIEEKEVPF